MIRMRHLWAAAAAAGLAAAPAAVAQTPAAVVNGEAVTAEEVEAVLRQRPPVATPLTEGQKRQLRQDVIAGLVDDLLVRQYLRQHGPKVEAAEVERQFADLRAELDKQGVGLARYLAESRQTEAQVKGNLATMLALNRWGAAKATDEALKAYYEANKDFFEKVSVRASHVVVRVPLTAAAAEVEQAKHRLEAVRAEVVAGKLPFAEAARKHSQCPSAAKGGDLDYFVRKWMMDEEFAKAAFALKVGEVSGVVRTEFGLHLVTVTDRTAPTPTTFQSAQEEVRDCFLEEMKQALLGDLRKSAKIEVK